jgi:hypothetical protein
MHSGDGQRGHDRENRRRATALIGGRRDMNPPSVRANRLQIATRIHYLLKRELGEGIDVGKMIKRDDYARDVLLVCDAHGPAHELARLAQAFRRCPADVGAPAGGWRDSQFAPTGFDAPRAAGPGDDAGSVRDAPESPPRTWFDRLLP